MLLISTSLRMKMKGRRFYFIEFITSHTSIIYSTAKETRFDDNAPELYLLKLIRLLIDFRLLY